MDWLKFIELICLPAIGWVFYKLCDLRREIDITNKSLSDFKVEVAKDYATNDAINRIEAKLDSLRNLMIDEIKRKNK